MPANASIMMVTYNRINLTKQTLECIANLDREFNLIIVDNGSTDETCDYLSYLAKNYKPKNLKDLIIHYNKKNKGIATGRNQGLKLADEIGTEWLCTLDNDVLVPLNFLSECIDILKTVPQYGGIGINFEGINYPLITINGKTFQDKKAGNLGTAAMLFPKAIHKMLGFFDHKSYGLYGLEDSSWGMRVRVAGFKLGYLQENGIHLGSDENDKGEYRAFKTEEHNKYLAKFNENCRLYASGQKPIYIPFKDE